jgi:hypothetical protein
MAKKKSDDNDVFVEISNRDVYVEMKQGFAVLTEKIDSFCKDNTEEHSKIIARQDKTNGKVILSRWIATTALALITTLIFLLMSGIIK